MKIAVLGTGMVGRGLAAKIVDAGHDVVIGTRNPEQTLARTEPDALGTPPFSEWHTDHQDVPLLPFDQAGAFAELIVNATAGTVSLAALEATGAANLAGKVLLDVALPLDLSHGMPPSLTVAHTDSLGEQIQRSFPDARVVKSLNTVSVLVMVDPDRLAGDHNIFVSGDDAEAKRVVQGVLNEFGWPQERIIDLGDIETARAAEMYSQLSFSLFDLYGDFDFNIAIARPAV